MNVTSYDRNGRELPLSVRSSPLWAGRPGQRKKDDSVGEPVTPAICYSDILCAEWALPSFLDTDAAHI